VLPYRHLPIAISLVVTGLGQAFAQTMQPAQVSGPIATLPDISTVPNMSCGKAYSPQWDNCVGLVTYPNGNVYRGEFHRGMREGFGFIVINAKGVSDHNDILAKEPAIYAGEFRGNGLNGHGVWFTKAGTGFSGTFIDNIPQSDLIRVNCGGAPSPSWNNCVARLTYGNGNTYYGEFMHGQRNGIGMLEIQATGISDETNIRTPVNGIYVGEFSGDRLNGRGMIFMPGAGFFGKFTNNVLDGSYSATSYGSSLRKPVYPLLRTP
jgi:hypothetical protein